MKNKSILNSIDSYFETKKPSEVKMYTLLALIVVGAIVYFLLSTQAQNFLDSEQSELDNITKKLDATNSYLASVSSPDGKDRNYKINQTTRLLKIKQKEFNDLLDANKYVEDKLHEVSSVTYNEKNWAKFLDDLTTLGTRYNIVLVSLKSWTRPLINGKVQEVLNVSLKGSGTFNNILAYINSIEESQMVVDVNGIDVNSTGRAVGGDINISLWGVKYGDSNINVDEANKNLANKDIK